jgi:WD40 repeat protein
VNFDGPVRVAENVGSGIAQITLSFDAWTDAIVAPTSHSVNILPPKAGPKEEAIAPNLIASLIHPERTASVWGVKFSPDGDRLFTTGYPSGVVQFWDVRAKKEIRRIETPPGYRGSADYALLTPDWKMLYVPVEKRSVESFERDGKKLSRIEYGGQIRVWDVDSGKEKSPLLPTEGFGPVNGKLSPDGRFLVSIERPGYVIRDKQPPDLTVVWELASGKKWKLSDGYAMPSFFPDSMTVAVQDYDSASKMSSVRVLNLTTAKELAKLSYSEKDSRVGLGPVAPDGSVIAMHLGGQKGTPKGIWFLDGKTLENRGKLVGKGDPEMYGWGYGFFAKSGKLFIALDGLGNVLLWDVAGQKVIRTWPSGSSQPTGRVALSPDGKTLAVGWAPKADQELASGLTPDPQDLPQPRVSLIDLEGNAPPKILIAPHGYVGSLAFSPDGKTLAFGGAGAVHLFDLTK